MCHHVGYDILDDEDRGRPGQRNGHGKKWNWTIEREEFQSGSVSVRLINKRRNIMAIAYIAEPFAILYVLQMSRHIKIFTE
ncbi:hypothetical protein M514_28521 [Trichuris suis]|uniref:Uncharacterized protein n=1 Tax=Trichuris suis TaxID=68888 RepID=A0A085MQ04_9BILA|nr:hypothetical protein M514_28521 [Trichuris suis]